MSTKASSLVGAAKNWATSYSSFTNGPKAAVLSVSLRFRAEWENNDAEAFADIFTENGSILVADEQLTGREEIREYFRKAFSGVYRGARVTEEPLEIRFLSPEKDVALAITQGGTVLDGETDLPADRESRTTWVIVKQLGEWKLLSRQSSPLAS